MQWSILIPFECSDPTHFCIIPPVVPPVVNLALEGHLEGHLEGQNIVGKKRKVRFRGSFRGSKLSFYKIFDFVIGGKKNRKKQ